MPDINNSYLGRTIKLLKNLLPLMALHTVESACRPVCFQVLAILPLQVRLRFLRNNSFNDKYVFCSCEQHTKHKRVCQHFALSFRLLLLLDDSIKLVVAFIIISTSTAAIIIKSRW